MQELRILVVGYKIQVVDRIGLFWTTKHIYMVLGELLKMDTFDTSCPTRVSHLVLSLCSICSNPDKKIGHWTAADRGWKKTLTLRPHPALSLLSAWPQLPAVTSLAMHAPEYHSQMLKDSKLKLTQGLICSHLAS